ncbi:MAG: NAD(P)-dependent oxidoreductase [Candidatus Limnocylindrales bacterium]|jgi:dTDP-4-dehydrorhamnose reductase
MRVAVTGAGGRLGSVLVKQLSVAPFVRQVLAWDLPGHDLDDPASAQHLVSMYRPDAVVHAAAWTDVDGCARDPALAMRRNGTAVGEMAEACVSSGAALVMVSTNEVFDGLRTDGLPYRPTDTPHPMNPYGEAKLAGERAARTAFWANGDEFAAAALDRSPARDSTVPALAIVRTAWLFGLPGSDFPQKILAAAARARVEGTTLKLVSDEIGCPTYATDLAAAIVALVGEAGLARGQGFGGIHHVVNAGRASRAEWAREVLRIAGMNVPTEDVPMATWPRPSTPPAWGVLEPTPLPGGPLRDWREALQEYAKLLPGFE